MTKAAKAARPADTATVAPADTATVAPAADAPAAPAADAPAAPAADAPAAPARPAFPEFLPAHTAGKRDALTALQRLHGQGAVLVRLPGGAGKLSTNLLATAPALTVDVVTLAALATRAAPHWAAFDVGYVAGPNASYAADAPACGVKKAKAAPAFVWAVPPADGAPARLLTASGADYAPPAPNAPALHKSNWQAAQAAVALAFAAPAPE